MPEDFHSHIDQEQIRIDALDSQTDQKIFSNEKDYTETFLTAVNSFQDFVRDQSADLPDEVKSQQLEDIRNFLKTVTDQNAFESLSQDLNAKLTEFRSTITSLNEELQKRTKTATGDTLGKIITKKLGISVEQDPQKFFQAVHFLQEKRQNPGSVLSFENGKVVWKQGNSDPNKLAIGEYILTDGLQSIESNSSDGIQWYLEFPSSAPYKNFVESITKKQAPIPRDADVPQQQNPVASRQPLETAEGPAVPDNGLQQGGSVEKTEASGQAVNRRDESTDQSSSPPTDAGKTDSQPGHDVPSISAPVDVQPPPVANEPSESEPIVEIKHDSISLPPVDEGTRRLGRPAQPDSELIQSREIWESLDESEQMNVLLTGAQQLETGVELSDPQKRRIEQVKLLMTAVQAMQQKIEEVKDWKGVFLSEGNMLHKLGVYMANEEDKKALLNASTDFLQNKALTLPQRIIQNPDTDLKILMQQDGNLISIMQKGGLDFSECNTEADLAAQKVKLIQYLRAIGDYQTARLTCEDELKGEFDAVLTRQFSQRMRSQTVQIGNETQQENVIGDIYDRVVEEVRKKSEETRAQAITELVDNGIPNPQQAYETHLQSTIYMAYQHEKNKTLAKAVYDNNTFASWSPEKQAYWKEYKDSMGIGAADVSDESMDTIINEFMINAPMIIVSGGLASGVRAVGTKVLSRGAQALMRREAAQNLILMAARSGYVADKALKLGKVARGIGTAGSLLAEGAVFEITNAGLHGEWIGNSPDWAQRILWSSATLGAFHQAGKIGKKLTGALTPLTEKISNTAVRKGVEELLIKGHVEVATMLLMGAIQNGVADRSALAALKALTNPEDIFHAYISAGALKVSGKGIETLSGKVLATAKKRRRSTESGEKMTVADIESGINIRAEHMRRIAKIDFRRAESPILERELPRMKHELSNIERTLKENPDLSAETRKSLERQKAFLEEKQTEFEAVLELRREDKAREAEEKGLARKEKVTRLVKFCEERIAKVSSEIQGLLAQIPRPNIKLLDLKGISARLTSLRVSMKALELRLPSFPDFQIRVRLESLLTDTRAQYGNLTRKLREKMDTLTGPKENEKLPTSPPEVREALRKLLEIRQKFEILAKDSNQAALTRDLLSDKQFLPRDIVVIDGREFYITNIFKTKDYLQVVIFTEINGKMLPRVLYKSHSDGGWRSCIGSEGGARYNKGEFAVKHYTQTTKPHEKIIEYLEQHESNLLQYNGDIINDHFDMFTDNVREVNTFANETRKYDDRGELRAIQKYQPGESFGTKGSLERHPRSGSPKLLTPEERLSRIESAYSTLPREFIPDFRMGPKATINRQHTLLGNITIETYETQLQGRKVDWNIAYDREGRVWIDRIAFTDAQVNSYGVSSEVIDSGFLTNKPLEYNSQAVALEFVSEKTLFESNADYVDITPFLDQIPAIKAFRAARQIYRQPMIGQRRAA